MVGVIKERRETMGKNKHRIVIVGFGGMGNWHRELIESGIDGLELAGMYDCR